MGDKRGFDHIHFGSQECCSTQADSTGICWGLWGRSTQGIGQGTFKWFWGQSLNLNFQCLLCFSSLPSNRLSNDSAFHSHTHIRSLTLVLWFSKYLVVRGCCCFGPLIQLKGMLLWLMRPQRDGLRAIRYLWRLPARGHQMNCFLQGRLIMHVLRSPLKRMLHITQVGTSARYSF